MNKFLKRKKILFGIITHFWFFSDVSSEKFVHHKNQEKRKFNDEFQEKSKDNEKVSKWKFHVIKQNSFE
jgi:hypothetical protein